MKKDSEIKKAITKATILGAWLALQELKATGVLAADQATKAKAKAIVMGAVK